MMSNQSTLTTKEMKELDIPYDAEVYFTADEKRRNVFVMDADTGEIYSVRSIH